MSGSFFPHGVLLAVWVSHGRRANRERTTTQNTKRHAQKITENERYQGACVTAVCCGCFLVCLFWETARRPAACNWRWLLRWFNDVHLQMKTRPKRPSRRNIFSAHL